MTICIDEVFRIINFVARIGVAAFLIRKYVIGYIQTSMSVEKSDLEYLQQQHVQLREACAQVEQQMKQDEQQFADLQTKFKTWNQQVEQLAMQQDLQCQQRQKKMEALLEKKMKYLQYRLIIEHEVATLLVDATESLQKEYAQDLAVGKQYRAKILSALRTNSCVS